MSAREKLNSAYLLAAIVPAVVLGLQLQSWTVGAFVAMAIVLVLRPRGLFGKAA